MATFRIVIEEGKPPSSVTLSHVSSPEHFTIDDQDAILEVIRDAVVYLGIEP